MSLYGVPQKHLAIIVALANGDSNTETAESCGVSVRTVVRVKGVPNNATLIRSLRAEMFSQASGRLAYRGRRAAEVLFELLGEQNQPQIRLGAAKAILEHMVKLAESVDQAEEIRKLKEQLRQQGIALS
jgi:hypothetical protein